MHVVRDFCYVWTPVVNISPLGSSFTNAWSFSLLNSLWRKGALETVLPIYSYLSFKQLQQFWFIFRICSFSIDLLHWRVLLAKDQVHVLPSFRIFLCLYFMTDIGLHSVAAFPMAQLFGRYRGYIEIWKNKGLLLICMPCTLFYMKHSLFCCKVCIVSPYLWKGILPIVYACSRDSIKSPFCRSNV